MNELSLERMEGINGGGIGGCVGTAVGVIGIVAIFGVAAAATGPLSIAATGWLMTQAAAAGIGTGLSLGNCIWDY